MFQVIQTNAGERIRPKFLKLIVYTNELLSLLRITEFSGAECKEIKRSKEASKANYAPLHFVESPKTLRANLSLDLGSILSISTIATRRPRLSYLCPRP